MSRYTFSNNWFDLNARSVWDRIIPQVMPQKILEIGSYEGSSACFLIDKLGDSGPLEIHCVDTWDGGIEHKEGGEDMATVEATFDRNLKTAIAERPNIRIVKHKGPSDLQLAGLLAGGKAGYFDFIYVDGSHQVTDVLCDAVLGFRLLKIGGVMVFDDYIWSEDLAGGKDFFRCPKPAIDAFVNIHWRKLHVINAPTLQCYVQKFAD